jgi:mRNA interferase RelE/StbE
VNWEIRLSPRAARALAIDLPEAAVAACLNFLRDVLAVNPYRVGRQLRPPLRPAYSARRGDYRVIYRVSAEPPLVEVLRIEHRRHAYRT